MNEQCPDIEMLAAYVDDNLGDEERRLIESHMAECRFCRKIMAQTFRAVDPKDIPSGLRSTDN